LPTKTSWCKNILTILLMGVFYDAKL
jgi:hypothetical protein